MENILKNCAMSMETRLRVLNCYIYPVLMYGSEAWSITTDLRKRLESCEMWFLRRMMRIPWTDRVSNEDVLIRAGVCRKLLKGIRIRQMRFMGHVLRKGGLENLALPGKIEGRRSRGRKRVTWLASIAEWIRNRGENTKEVELLNMAIDRELWHNMIAKVS
ncbi:uncharacterized protein [Antedon mediterranea]|uniref:uncharacterized protein n=1 Tax=Antedon mediterranea TaxID=105859 RepID=UPI003AF88799